MKIIAYLVFFVIFLSGCFFNVSAENGDYNISYPDNETVDDVVDFNNSEPGPGNESIGVDNSLNDTLPPGEFLINPGEFVIINLTADGNVLNVTITFKNEGNLNIYLIEKSRIEKKKFVTENLLKNITADFKLTGVLGSVNHITEFRVNVVKDREYQIIIQNIGSEILTIDLGLDMSSQSISAELLGIVLIIVLGIVLIFSIIYSHKNRILVHREKKDLNHTLEKVIDVYKDNPDKVLDIIKEMSESANQEGHKLTDVLTTVTNKVSDRLGKS